MIVDRFSRFAKIGGEMISLATVEGHILEAVEDDTIVIAAVAIADVRKGEKIILLSEQPLELEPLRKKLLESDVAALLIPGAILKVDEIPKLGSGKTNYPVLNELARTLTEAAV